MGVTVACRAKVRLIGASIPRSGHHYLARLLAACLGNEFEHCEFYDPPGCCRSVPCARRATAPVAFQKNHDFDLRLPRHVAGTRAVVQYREPIGEALSDREYLAEVRGAAIAADRDDYAVWLGTKAAYMVGFAAKWIAAPRADDIRIDYAELRSDPRAVLARMDLAIAPDAAERAVIDASKRGGHFGDRPYTPRGAGQGRFVHWDMLEPYLAILARHAPVLPGLPAAPTVEPDHTVAAVYHAARAHLAGDARTAATRLADARSIDGDNPHLASLLGQYYLDANQAPAAVRVLDAARAGLPRDELLLTRLCLARFLSGDTTGAYAASRDLIAAHPDSDSCRLRHAWLAIESGDRVPAIETLRAFVAKPAAVPWLLDWAAGLFMCLGMPAEAIAAEGRAVAIAPDNPRWRDRLHALQRERVRS